MKITEKNKDWMELCKWVEINIFNYDINNNQRLQKKSCLILRGLTKGQDVANNNLDTYGEYPYNVILMTFKANKSLILNSIKNKDFEDDESNKMFYVCAIIRNKINDIYSRYLKAQKTQEKVKSVDTSIMEHEGAEYKGNTEKKVNKRLEGLW